MKKMKKELLVNFYGTLDQRDIGYGVFKMNQADGDPFGCRVQSGEWVHVIQPTDGFLHDYASIPQFAMSIIGPSDGKRLGANYGWAAVIHDWLYSNGKPGDKYGRQYADLVFKSAMTKLGVTTWRKNVMYWAVRLGGNKYYGQPMVLDKLRGVDKVNTK